MDTRKKLTEYIDFIQKFEETVRKEDSIPDNVNIWSYMISNSKVKGTVASYKYILHGSGFIVEKDTFICEYDKAPLNEFDIKFSFWKFKSFIESNYKGIIIDDDMLKKDLSYMINKNVLAWLIIDGINWNIYQTNFTNPALADL
ncbi:hypothetical protein [Chryseobacterium sp.]|uniref:DUF6896 domain-containing protein n=1 Tax=Chryseobacterium sp. TaxID=1871047 RepID=UPI0035C74FAB